MENLRQMWLDYAHTAAAGANARQELHGTINAEIVPGVTPQWHVLITAPNEEKRAAAHLAQRRFGVYQPRYERKIRDRAGNLNHLRQAALLPNYLLVFTWDIDRHWRRIRACPGVINALRGGNGHPAIVPQSMILRLLNAEFSSDCMPSLYANQKRRSRRGAALERELKVVPLSTTSSWRGLDSVDSSERLSAFRKAMGLET